MCERLEIHPTHPQARLIRRAVERLREGALLVYPTDSGYALGWTLDNRDAQERVVRMRGLDFKHNFTVVCRHLSEVGTYARMDDAAFRLVKSLVPGPYTFILAATALLPRRLQQAKKRSVGVRLPDHPVAQALVEALAEPLLSSSLLFPGTDMDGWEVEDLFRRVASETDVFLDAGHCGIEPTTVVDLLEGFPVVLRQGKGKLVGV